MDMNDFRGGSIAVMHTEQRVLELKETLGQILSSGTLSRKEAEKLRGRLIWFSSFVFGRRPNRAVATLSAIASSASHSSSLTEEHKLALGSLLEYVDVCRPVSISRRILEFDLWGNALRERQLVVRQQCCTRGVSERTHRRYNWQLPD